MEPNHWFAGGTNLTAVDGLLVFGCLALMFWIGWWFGRDEKSTDDFFLGGRRIPIWVACLSFVATEISAMTIIGVPATGFRENWNYGQFFIGSAASKVAVAFLFLPAFYKYNSTTIYEFLRHRFGPATQYTATCFFFVTRLLASGVRLMAACLAVSVLLGWHIIPTIVLFSVIGVVYIGYGGIKAVVWTNVLQALTFVAAGLAAVAFILSRIDLIPLWNTAWDAGRLDFWHLTPSAGMTWISDPNIIWVAIFNGFFGSMAAFGTDHEMMQKLLTVETRRASQLTLLWSILGSFLVLVLFLFVGTSLFSFYQLNPGYALPEKLDKIFPHFASTVMPSGLRGLVLAAIVMASIDSPLASLTAVFVTDIYKPLFKPEASQKHYLFVSRVAIVAFAFALAFIAWYFSQFDKILWLAFKIGGVTFGSLLGVFLFGMLSKKPANKANVAAMLIMAVANAVLLMLSEKGIFPLGWSWLVVLGTFGTWGLAHALSSLEKAGSEAR